MPRVKRGVPAHKKHKKVLDAVKGHKGAKSKLFRPANESLLKSLRYAYRDRRVRKRDFRRLWIVRINAAARLNGVSYSVLMNKFKQANITIDRKILADLAVRDPDAFAQLIQETAVSD
ncbi:MAG TPA: 50S ribosomal protein L20 [Chloroflexota bacterium]|jgi:large subunit ribosomal protein L20|nr:50S ribosomal protein L20 [Chloroflexota bacterium]